MSKLHFVVITLLLTTVACLAETAEKVYPYKAQIIGTDVYIRSGSASQFYFTGKLSDPQQVIVVEQRLGWSKIVPPKGSFSWVAKEFIQIDSDNPGNGIVTGNGLRVWAGRADIRPEDSTSQQTTLNKNDVVKLIGEEVGDYYKIKSPDKAFLWIKSDYLKYLGPVSLPTFKPKVKTVKPTAPVEKAAVKETPTPQPKVVKTVEPTKKPVETVKGKPAPSVVIREPVVIKQSPEEIASLKKVYKLVEEVNLEKKKPADKQDFTKIKASLKDLAKNDKIAKAKKYAQYQLDEIESYELSRDVIAQMKAQDSELSKIRKELQEQRKQKSAVILKETNYALVGKLKKSQVYDDRAGQARYLVVDDNGKIACYAIPVKTAAGMNIEEYIGKRVGLKGKFVPDTKTGISLLKFEDMQVIEK